MRSRRIADGSIVPDRLLHFFLRFTIISLIAILALACCILGYNGIYCIITGRLQQCAQTLIVSMALGVTSALLIRYRSDLIDQRL